MADEQVNVDTEEKVFPPLMELLTNIAQALTGMGKLLLELQGRVEDLEAVVLAEVELPPEDITPVIDAEVVKSE